jgi:DNA-binding transcriptional LysR family regulator
MLDFEDLETFVEIADAGGLSPAARRLGVSKSIISRRLLRLEAELGVQLLARTTRGTALTEAGATFREHATRVRAELETARETMLPSGDLRGRLRIAAPASFGPFLLAPVLVELAQRYPLLQIHASYEDRFVDVVAEGFDCALRVGHLMDSNLVARRIRTISWKLVASPSYVRNHGAPETPETLFDHQALMHGTETWRLRDGDDTVAVHPRGRFKADNATVLAEAALAGVGIALLPDCLTDSHLESGALVQVMPRFPVPDGGLYVVRPPGRHPARKVRALTELMVEHFG